MKQPEPFRYIQKAAILPECWLAWVPSNILESLPCDTRMLIAAPPDLGWVAISEEYLVLLGDIHIVIDDENNKEVFGMLIADQPSNAA